MPLKTRLVIAVAPASSLELVWVDGEWLLRVLGNRTSGHAGPARKGTATDEWAMRQQHAGCQWDLPV